MTPTTVTSGLTPPSETSDRQSGGRGKNKKNRKQSSGTSASYMGKCSDIKEHVYDMNAGKSGFDVFVRTTREIAEYVSSNLKDASEF